MSICLQIKYHSPPASKNKFGLTPLPVVSRNQWRSAGEHLVWSSRAGAALQCPMLECHQRTVTADLWDAVECRKDRRAKKAFSWNPEEKRRCGQPNTSWKETLMHDVQQMDIRQEVLLDKAVSTEKWLHSWTALRSKDIHQVVYQSVWSVVEDWRWNIYWSLCCRCFSEIILKIGLLWRYEVAKLGSFLFTDQKDHAVYIHKPPLSQPSVCTMLKMRSVLRLKFSVAWYR